MLRILLLPLNLLQVVLMWIWTTIGVVLAMLVMLVARRPHPALWMAHRPWSPVAMAILLGRVEVEVESEPDFQRTHVVVCNHQSMADIPTMFYAMRTPIRFIAKRELFALPVVGWYLRSTGMIPVDRARGRAAMERLVREGSRDLDGTSVVAFPEGTRSRDGSLGRFKKGAFRLAMERGLPVLPVSVEGTRHLVSRSGLFGRPARVQVRIGAAIETDGMEESRLGELVERAEAEVRRLHAGSAAD